MNAFEFEFKNRKFAACSCWNWGRGVCVSPGQVTSSSQDQHREKDVHACIHIYGQFKNHHLDVWMYGLWVGTRAPTGNPSRHRGNFKLCTEVFFLSGNISKKYLFWGKGDTMNSTLQKLTKNQFVQTWILQISIEATWCQTQLNIWFHSLLFLVLFDLIRCVNTWTRVKKRYCRHDNFFRRPWWDVLISMFPPFVSLHICRTEMSSIIVSNGR